MYYVDRNNVITLTRGDSLEFPVEVLRGEFPYERKVELDDTCIVYFGLMEPHQLFEDAILKKVYSEEDTNEDGDIIIKIDPIDTVDLFPGVYYYSVKLLSIDNISGEEKVDTLIQKSKFILLD